MMKSRFFLSLSLVAVLFAACAPAAQSLPTPDFMETIVVFATQSAIVDAKTPSQTALPSVGNATPLVMEMSTVAAIATQQASAPTAFPIATSRGPDLEATDPSTVNLASGQIHFVEFF